MRFTPAVVALLSDGLTLLKQFLGDESWMSILRDDPFRTIPPFFTLGLIVLLVPHLASDVSFIEDNGSYCTCRPCPPLLRRYLPLIQLRRDLVVSHPFIRILIENPAYNVDFLPWPRYPCRLGVLMPQSNMLRPVSIRRRTTVTSMWWLHAER
ncbi:hypothetical protein PAECIP111893_03996 [Paenibacillus plantiphilus]|uniref:Uncharacterized protein n=1 Tax=Paenibacillus plantiphilus TaxID=2905650 RepID=A0ABN8GQP2_9BACL|nr:hypothetical protein PAECIP111893_03996 [Paenibacillus plantiphilus]